MGRGDTGRGCGPGLGTLLAKPLPAPDSRPGRGGPRGRGASWCGVGEAGLCLAATVLAHVGATSCDPGAQKSAVLLEVSTARSPSRKASSSALTGSPASPFSPGRPGLPRSPWDTEQVKVRGARPVSFWELVKGPRCPGGVQAPSPSLVAHFGVCEARCMCPTPHPFRLPCWVPRQWHQPTEPRAGNLGPERTPPAVCGRPPRGSQALRDASGRAPPPHREWATLTPALRHRVIGGPLAIPTPSPEAEARRVLKMAAWGPAVSLTPGVPGCRHRSPTLTRRLSPPWT